MTTIFYPDLSHYDLDRGVTVEPGTVAVIAKATHGAAFLDRGYTELRRQAQAVGALFGTYHWLNHRAAGAQARYCHDRVGRTPVMVDAEDMPDNTGYAGPLTVADILEFVTTLRAVGGRCNLVYLPSWYWADHMGAPDLTPLDRLGVGLVASNYTTYSDSGPGWASYGGMTPVVWQYTDKLPYGGASCDFNAYRGDLAGLRALLEGDDMGPLDQTVLPAEHAPDGIARTGALILEELYLMTRWGRTIGDTNPRAVGWVINALAGHTADLAAIRASESAAAAAIAALVDLVRAGGGDVDTAALLDRIDQAAAAVRADVHDLVVRLGAAARAQADTLNS